MANYIKKMAGGCCSSNSNGAQFLIDLNDTDIVDPQQADLLFYDRNSNKWVNGNMSLLYPTNSEDYLSIPSNDPFWLDLFDHMKCIVGSEFSNTGYIFMDNGQKLPITTNDLDIEVMKIIIDPGVGGERAVHLIPPVVIYKESSVVPGKLKIETDAETGDAQLVIAEYTS